MIEGRLLKISIDRRTIGQESKETRTFGLKTGLFRSVEKQVRLIEKLKN